MIFVHDKGQMCNNILQYGHLYAWGREHGRETMSMRFAYKYQYFNICHTRRHNFLTYAFAKYAAKLKLIPTASFDEEDAPTDQQEHLMLTHRFVMAEGWYVRYYDLFLKYKQEILQLFTFLPEVQASVAAKMNGEQKGVLRLGIHIRRGDYKTFNGGKFFYSDEQYVKVIQQFIALHPEQPVAIYICGNDPKLDKGYYRRKLAPSAPVSPPQGGGGDGLHIIFPDGNPGEDLCLLSQCDYLIGPPSTFSLVASMYRDVPLCWLTDINSPLLPTSFGHFDYLFRHII